jgi:hypothetical protein
VYRKSSTIFFPDRAIFGVTDSILLYLFEIIDILLFALERARYLQDWLFFASVSGAG